MLSYVNHVSPHSLGNITTQILRRAQPEGVLLCSDRPRRALIVLLLVSNSQISHFFPNIPRNQLFRAVGKAIPADKPHPLLLHVAERDRGGAKTWVTNFCKLLKRLRRRMLPIFRLFNSAYRSAYYLFEHAFGSYNKPARISYCALRTIVVALKVTSTYFSTAVGHIRFGTSSFRLGHLSFRFDQVGLTSRVLDCLPFVLREHLSARALKIYGLLWSRSRFILSGRIGTEDFSTTAPQHLLLQLFR
uniref:AlNc14C8G1076 protein n=1 Tax=Albugo laibachii Nc14 TaxID=890382 RepID=F0W1Z7_9STRA|nr:AlNc14C8G1076 [Albugo laibachii Nc14]|eukprot:CCA15076.1 AlNc14C8G1076 [Albugo laibachii Nc14]